MIHHDDAGAAGPDRPHQAEVGALLPPLDGELGPALPIDDGRASAIVAGALIGWGGPAAATNSTPPPPPPPAMPVAPSLFVRALPWGAGIGAAALAALGGFAVVEPSAPEMPSAAPIPSVAAAPEADAIDLAPPRLGDRGAWVVGEPSSSAAAETRTPEPRNRAATTSTRRADRRPGPRAGDAGDLLARANRLRAEGQFQQAESIYRAAARAGRGSLTAYVAQVAAGSIRLEHLNDPRGARDAYLAARRTQPGGPLDVEVQQGLAAAARQLGDVSGERRALRALLAATPEGPVAERARARLARLAGGG